MVHILGVLLPDSYFAWVGHILHLNLKGLLTMRVARFDTLLWHWGEDLPHALCTSANLR